MLRDPSLPSWQLREYIWQNGYRCEENARASNTYQGTQRAEVSAHELAICQERLAACLQHPNLSLRDWKHWLHLNVAAGFANPAYPLYLLEEPALFTAARPSYWNKALVCALKVTEGFAWVLEALEASYAAWRKEFRAKHGHGPLEPPR